MTNVIKLKAQSKAAKAPAAPPRTDLQLRALKPNDRPYSVRVEPGLYLRVMPSPRDPAGTKTWVYRYQADGTEKRLGLGPFPAIGLAAARAKALKLQAERVEGGDPAVVRQEARAAKQAESTNAAQTFEAVAREWHRVNESRWKPHHAQDVLGRLEEEVFPKIGNKPVTAVTPGEILDVIRAIEPRSIDIAHRVRARLKQIFDFAFAEQLDRPNPAERIKVKMAPMPKGGFRPAITSDLDSVRVMLRKVESNTGFASVKAANRFLALTAVRPGEMRQIRWEQIEGLDGPEPIWRVPSEAMKPVAGHQMEHVVPLSRQAVELLQAMRPITGKCPLVFPSVIAAHHPMSENTIGHLLDRAGYRGKHCAHGWRASFSTLMNANEDHPEESVPAHREKRIIEAALAHHGKDEEVARRYNRGVYLNQRRKLMQEWADMLLDGAIPASELVIGKKRLDAH